MSRMLYRWGRTSAERPWVAIGAWLVVTVIVVAAAAGFGRQLEDSMAAPGTDSQAAADLLAQADDGSRGMTAYVAATPRDGSTFFESATARRDLAALQASIGAVPRLVGMSDPAGALAVGRGAALESGQVSPDGRVALVRLQYPEIDQLGAGDLDALKAALDRARGASLRIEGGGDLYFSFEEPPAGISEAIGLVVAVVILLVAFGSMLAAGMPLAIALFGLLVGSSLLPVVAHLVDIPAWAPMMASMVGLGVGIDYALFLLTRHREGLAAGLPVAESVGRAVATAGQAVVFAGGTVVVAILGLAFAGLPFVTAAGVGISVVVLVMVMASVTLLPALLGLAGHRIGGRGRRGRRLAGAGSPSADADPAVRRWTRWGRHVTRHATVYALVGSTALVALAAPVLALRLGVPDQGSLPEARTERRAYDLVAEGFGPGATGPLVVAVDVSRDRSVVGPLADAIAADPGIVSAVVAPGRADADVAVLLAQPTTSPQDAATVVTIERLRDRVLPQTLADREASAHVGGYTAALADLSQRVEERLPLFVTAVVITSFLLLVVLFRSVLVPLKAAVLNLLSVGAAYGVLVMVFQWGWGADLIGLEATVPIMSFIPLFMFAILFGLSMDYEVFLLSRVREEWLRTRDNDHSVVHGIGVTARTISCGAAIMVAVFGGFAFGSEPLVKMLGLGLATAVLVDATLVRLVLVPALMRLLGDANWWLPAWLDRWLPSLDADPSRWTAAEPPEPPVPATVPGRDRELEVRL